MEVGPYAAASVAAAMVADSAAVAAVDDASVAAAVCCGHGEAPCETFNAIGQILGEEDCIAYVSGRDESYQSD